VSLIENVPVSTEAPSGMSLMVVKFSMPGGVAPLASLLEWQACFLHLDLAGWACSAWAWGNH
jgi:hypothetical protein